MCRSIDAPMIPSDTLLQPKHHHRRRKLARGRCMALVALSYVVFVLIMTFALMPVLITDVTRRDLEVKLNRTLP